MWKAIITAISEVDSAGNVSVNFDVVNDKSIVKYPNMQTSGQPDNIVNQITKIIIDLKQQTASAKLIAVGQEITIN